MTDQPAPPLAPDDAHGEPNSIDLLYGSDHPRELVAVLQLREQRMREAGEALAGDANWLLGLLEMEGGGEKFPDARLHVRKAVAAWREACR